MSAAETRLKREADRLGFHHMSNHEPSFWLRARLVSLTSTPRTCGHVPLLFGALWDRRLVCAACSPTLIATGDDNFRCDRCGVVEHPITVGAVVWMRLLVSFGLCRACCVAEYGRPA